MQAALAVFAGIIGLAIVAVLVSRNAQTSNVIGAGATGLSAIISAAVQPVTGNNLFGSSAGVGGAGGLLGQTA